MKHKIQFYNVLICAVILTFTACGDSSTGDPLSQGNQTPGDGKKVASQYRFPGNGTWESYPGSVLVPGAISLLNADSFTVTGATPDISYTGVYTDCGGTHLQYGYEWEYLYDAADTKIGIVASGYNFISVSLGKLYVELAIGNEIANGKIDVDTSDMQDTTNGWAVYEF